MTPAPGGQQHRRHTATRARLGVLALLVALLGSTGAGTADAVPASPFCGDEPGDRQVVILVHGFSSGPHAWSDASAARLTGNGAVPACVVRFDYATSSTYWVTQPQIAPRLAIDIRRWSELSSEQGGSGKVALVAHSMGGLAIRCSLDVACSGQPGIDEAVAGVVTFGTPHLGTFWKGRGKSWVANAGGVGYGSACRILEQLREIPADSPPCRFVRAMFTSNAARAFTPGSAQLRSLRPLTGSGDFPILALASRVPVRVQVPVSPGTNVINRFLAMLNQIGAFGTLGDLIVDESSALAESRTTEPGLGGARTVPGPWQTTWHSKQTTNPTFLTHAARFIARIAAQRQSTVTSDSDDLAPPAETGPPLSAKQVAALAGTWRGPIDQPGTIAYSVEVQLRVDAGGLAARAAYPELDCSGSWSSPRGDGSTVLLDELIEVDDAGMCVPEDVIRLRPLPGGGLAYTAYVDDEEYAWGVLTRQD